MSLEALLYVLRLGEFTVIPAVGTVLKFVGSAFKIPAKALKTATKTIKDLPAKIQANEEARGEDRSSLLSMIGRATDTKANARKLWNTLNKNYISPITKPLPSLKFVNAENLIKKPLREQAKESAKEQLQKNRPTREKRERTFRSNIRHQDLKEKWKQERRQRNSELRFDEVYSPNIERQKDIEYRQLEDFYDILLDQNATETDKIKAELKLEQEKLNHKYQQLELLQDSLLAIQKNFGKLAVFNENSFDALQDQIAASAEIADSKQTFYSENISSDIENLQVSNDNNAEIIVGAIEEGQKLQAETLDQLSTMEEQAINRDSQIGEALQIVEQQQKERHIQQMYVLNNIGAEIVAAEQQQRAQKTERDYLYDKFTKKQKKEKSSLLKMFLGGVMGIMSSFLNALANPQHIVETMAETAGSFVAEVLSLLQLIFGNTVYGLGHVYAWFNKPIKALLSHFFSEESLGFLPNQKKLDELLQVSQVIPRTIGMGMPDMIILPKPDMTSETSKLVSKGVSNLLTSPIKTIASLPGQIIDDIREAKSKGFWETAKTVMGHSGTIGGLLALPPLMMTPVGIPAAVALATKIASQAGKIDFNQKAQNTDEQQTAIKGNTIKVPALPDPLESMEKKPPKNNIDVKELTTPSNSKPSNKQSQDDDDRKKDVDPELAMLEGGGNYIDNSTTNNIFQTYTTQQEKQFGAGA